MKLVDFYNFEPFNRIKDQMGIGREERAKFRNHLKVTVASEWGSIQSVGLEIDLHELEVCEDGTLEHQNHPGKKIAIFTKTIDDLTGKFVLRYHIAWCQQIQLLAKEPRGKKYIISQDPEDMRVIKEKNINGDDVFFERGEICKSCLLVTNYEGYRQVPLEDKAMIVNSFSMAKFVKNISITSRKENQKKEKSNAREKYYSPFQERMIKISNEINNSKKSVFKEDCKLNEQNYMILQKLKQNNYLFDDNIKEIMLREFKKCTPLIKERVDFINDEIYFNLGYKNMIITEEYGKDIKFLYNPIYKNINI